MPVVVIIMPVMSVMINSGADFSLTPLSRTKEDHKTSREREKEREREKDTVRDGDRGENERDLKILKESGGAPC